jgi:hypothetical protein
MLHIRGPIFKFSELFQIVTIVAHSDILRSMGLVLGVSKLLVMTKDIGSLRPIVVSKVFI